MHQLVILEPTQEAFNKSWEEWGDIYRQRGDILEKACKMLNEKSDGEIEAEVRRGADIGNALKILNDTLRGCNVREQNWLSLEQFLLNGNPAQNWLQLMRELRPLAEMSKEEIPSDGTVPNVPTWPLTQAMCRNIVERLSPRRWLDIALTGLEDLPVFYYKGKDTDRIEFKNASAGQQATALLKVLLKESTGPLMIDQPEEDLDNAIIQQITEELWKAKERRQIIFSSHNANIVVNGDAELVIRCDYRKEGDRTKGHIAGEGAIDVAEIKDAIKSVMEGGEKAFELRRRKYGF